MDSLTHIVLGAVVGEAAVGKKMGNKALVYGAIAGSLPDFDVFVARFFDPVDALFVHRGFSHSLFLLVILAPLAAYAVKHFSHNPRLT
ncbi:MAG TPA: metal-dependent hydrolase, partial [Tenuifilaceae bacterium]|nr:metal-dependent hydrolase [Tenuifilaceae bacterium]